MLAFAAEPVEKPDARLLALDCHSPPIPVSQCISLDHLTLIITPSNDLKIHVRLTRDPQITRSYHHATNAVYPPASRHGVFVWIKLGTGVNAQPSQPSFTELRRYKQVRLKC